MEIYEGTLPSAPYFRKFPSRLVSKIGSVQTCSRTSWADLKSLTLGAMNMYESTLPWATYFRTCSSHLVSDFSDRSDLFVNKLLRAEF